MSGIVFWAHSFCRSTFSFYEGLATAFKVPAKYFVFVETFANRTEAGFDNHEYQHLDITFVGDNPQKANALFLSHKNWHHIFGTYQQGKAFQQVIMLAKTCNASIGIASEAPCNMHNFPKSIAKEFYIKYLLKLKVFQFIKVSDFIINFSGSDSRVLSEIGWPDEKILPCGYASPPLPHSRYIERSPISCDRPHILITGKHDHHRDHMTFFKALNHLKTRGFTPKVTCTQTGPLTSILKEFCKEHSLNTDFTGFMELSDLVQLYQNCDLFVGSGISEPWGIRVNDAIHCGAPVVISSGMGAKMIIEQFQCGSVFCKGNFRDLADKIYAACTDENQYYNFAQNVRSAHFGFLPRNKAGTVASMIKSSFPNWGGL